MEPSYALQHALHELMLLPDGSGGWRELESVPPWRLRDRLKTVAAALVMCLNVGVDPPDVVKPEPCAQLECWLDPSSMPAQKALEAIGKALQAQYECWQPRARYRICADPTLEELRKVCIGLRRAHGGREERLLLHFNGHGVPRPSKSGELWVFNRSFTQYIPVSAYDLHCWLGSPCIMVIDCSHAARVIDALAATMGTGPSSAAPESGRLEGGAVLGEDLIILCACGADSQLPTNPELAADVFTSCLTTPLRMALRFACRNALLQVPTPIE